MKVRMSEDDHTDVETEDDSTGPLPNEGRDDYNIIQEGWKQKQKREERKKRKEKDICLTSYNAWWTRVEKEEKKSIVKSRKFEEE